MFSPIERVTVTDEVVEEEENAVSLPLAIGHYLPHYRFVPLLVRVRLGEIETLPCVVESQCATEDEDVLSEVLLVAVLGNA